MTKDTQEREGKLHFGYLVVAALVLTSFIPLSLALSCAGIFYPPLSEALGVEKGVLSYYISVLWLAALVARPFMGRLLDGKDARVCLTAAVAIVVAAFAAYAVIFTGCGRSISNSYETVRASSDQVNPMVTSMTSSIREKAFATSLCLPEDTGNGKADSIKDAGLFDLSKKKTIYGAGLTQNVYPASTTKLMTALVAVKNGSLNQRIWISERAAYPGADAQRLVLEPGDSMTLEQALNYLLVFSANDVAIAIAENIGGSYDHFIEMMNEEALAIGATGTHFTNPHGLHDDDHYTTPYDLYLILNQAVKHKVIREILPKSEYNTSFVGEDGSSKSIAVKATDAYLTGEIDPPEGITVIGGKTGTTELAGHCLVIYTENKEKHHFISVLMKTESLEDLYDGMNSLLSQIPN